MIKIEDLLEAGVHFGHRVTKWNPRMAPFIFGERNGIHIIDLIQTLYYLEESSKFLQHLKSRGNGQKSDPTRSRERNILFVGTKKQASSLVESCANKINKANHGGNLNDFDNQQILTRSVARSVESSIARKAGQAGLTAHFVNHRWLGGLLTNWSTMRICIDQLNKLEKREESGELQNLPKKERSILKKQYEKLNKFFGGIKTMKQKPDLVIIVGQDHEMNAVRECNKLAKSSEFSSSDQGAGTAGRNNTNSSTKKIEKTTELTLDRGSLISEPLRTITLLDTNCDPALADIFIPANDDSTKSLELILGQLTEVLCES
jgi:small subunit ribosomal protein S2